MVLGLINTLLPTPVRECGSVPKSAGPSVRPSNGPISQVETKMFLDGSSIAPLHAEIIMFSRFSQFRSFASFAICRSLHIDDKMKLIVSVWRYFPQYAAARVAVFSVMRVMRRHVKFCCWLRINDSWLKKLAKLNYHRWSDTTFACASKRSLRWAHNCRFPKMCIAVFWSYKQASQCCCECCRMTLAD